MRERLIEFLQAPSRASYLAVRTQLVAADTYQPYSEEFEDACELFEQNKLQQASDLLLNAMDNLLLSPRAHRLLELLHEKLGNTHAAQMERLIYTACIEGLMSTGDGSRSSPILVVRTSDEHDVLLHLGTVLQTQALSHHAEQTLDRVVGENGDEYWFDITDAYNHLSRSFGQGR